MASVMWCLQEDSTTDSPYADYSDDVTSSMGGTDDRDETPGESGGDADDEVDDMIRSYHHDCATRILLNSS